MSKADPAFGRDALYRVDKFIVPEAALPEFMQRVEETQTVLRQQPGFVRSVILQQCDGPGRFNIVTFVEWESGAVLAEVREKVAAFHRERGFDPQAYCALHGITADIGVYRWIGE